MRALELVADFLEEPERAAAAAAERPRVGLALAGYLVGGLSLYLAQALMGRFLLFGASGLGLALACLWHLCLGVLLCALLHLLAEALGGSGRAVPLFTLLGLSDLGWALALPGALLLRALAPGWGTGTTLLFTAAWLVTLSLKARSVSHNYGLGRGQAWLVICLPYAAAICLTVVSFSVALLGALRQVLKLAA